VVYGFFKGTSRAGGRVKNILKNPNIDYFFLPGNIWARRQGIK